MAFEHSGLEVPEDYVPGEEPSHVGASPKTLPQGRRATREARLSFGVDVEEEPGGGRVEARKLLLVRAIEGRDAGDGVPDTLELDASPPKRLALAATGLFLGACAAGFGVVWLLARS
ncbi:hypothetical protein [Stigmatella hybrida]|uniref:hypothetical protein n=1 Tax=Stigmatella hybrida TaxID=394097 RepID=UPI001CDAE57C|nr:hypothetical protein [Stigmatella hybrida]